MPDNLMELWEKFKDLVRLDAEDVMSIDLHPERDLMCSDCGVRPSRTNSCAGCGGFAYPSLNIQLSKRWVC